MVGENVRMTRFCKGVLLPASLVTQVEDEEGKSEEEEFGDKESSDDGTSNCSL